MKILKFLMYVLLVMLLFICCKGKSSPTASDNNTPELSFIGNLTVLVGQTIEITLHAVDVDGDSLIFSIPANPGFLSITEFSHTGDSSSVTLIIAPEQNDKGTYNATVKVYDNKGGEDKEDFTIEVMGLTNLFLRKNDSGSLCLSTEQTPAPSGGGTYANISYFLTLSSVKKWQAILGSSIEGSTYGFSLWLAANYPQGIFDVYLSVVHNEVETVLAKTKFTVPSSQYYQRFSKTVNGRSGGAPGDEIILKIYFTGSSGGSIIFGSDYYSDSHIIIPGDIIIESN